MSVSWRVVIVRIVIVLWFLLFVMCCEVVLSVALLIHSFSSFFSSLWLLATRCVCSASKQSVFGVLWKDVFLLFFLFVGAKVERERVI